MANENKTYFAKAASTTKSFNFKDIFSNVLVKHSRKDMDSIFSAGLTGHVPDGSSLLNDWQKPWLFSRFFIYGLAALALLSVVTNFQADMINIGAICLLPAIIVPFTVTLFFWEMNIPRNIPFYDILKFIVFGGIACSFVAGVTHFALGADQAANEEEENLLIGVVEELTKLIVVAFILRKSERCWGLNGLLIGAAVGCGFDLFETNGYVIKSLITALQSYKDETAMPLVLKGAIERGYSGLVGHVPWAAMYGGTLALAKGKQKLDAKHFADSRFLISFLSAILIHAAFDYFGTRSFVEHFVTDKMSEGLYKVLSNQYVFYAVFAVIEYAVILWVLRLCVRQVAAYAGSANMINEHQYQAFGNNDKVRNPGAAAGAATLQVECVAGELSGQTFTVINGTTITIGRDSSSNIQFSGEAKGISRTHCSISFDGRKAYVTDLGSSHGTFFANGKKLQPNMKNPFKNGETFYLASPKNTFCIHIR